MTAKPEITVVVCSFNGSASIARTLDALERQTARARAEVVVVDDGSADATAAAATRPGVTVIRHDVNAGLAAARNTGWQAASAPLVAFTDDDCRPAPSWLEALLAGARRHPDAQGLGGAVTGSSGATFLLRYLQRNNPLAPLEADLLADDRILHRLRMYVRRSGGATLQGEREVASVVGANMAFRRRALETAGGFDERFRFGGEEEDLCRRLVRSGNALLFVPDAVVDHDFEPSLRDTVRRSVAYGRGNARMFLKHAELRPTVYPLPAAVAALLVVGAARRSVPAFALAAALPALLFSKWPRAAAREGDPELLLYPYLQLVQETCGNVGVAQGISRFRADFPERRQVAS